MFITFEGIDGSGKTTQARRLSATLTTAGYPVVTVREPGGTRLGEEIRTLLLDPEGDVTPRAELLLFSAARAHLIDRVIRPALDDGAVVIADRFFDSTTAYQAGGRGVMSVEAAEALHGFVTAGLCPDLTVFVDLDVETALQRRGPDEDRMEAADRAFHERVRDTYLALATRHPERVLKVDGRATTNELTATITRAVMARLRAD